MSNDKEQLVSFCEVSQLAYDASTIAEDHSLYLFPFFALYA